MNIKSLLSLTLFLSLSTSYAGSPVNLIGNNDFVADIDGWSHAFGQFPATWNGTDGDLANGSLEVGDDGGFNLPPTSIVTVTTCVSPVAGGMNVVTNIGVSYKLNTGTISGSCAIATKQSTTLDCGSTFGPWDTGTAMGASPNGTWKTTTTGTPSFDSSTVSAQVRFICVNTASDPTPFSVLFDDPFLTQPTLPVELQNFSVE